MATSQYTNNATTTIAGALSSGVTSFSVAATAGTLFPVLTGSNYFYATIIDSANVIEVVKVTARVGDVMTVVRAQDGSSSPTTFASASRFELRVVAASLADKANIDGSNVATATWANLSIGGNAATATSATTATNLAATLAVANGGTGATTAAAARTSLGALGTSDTITNATNAVNVTGTVAVANGGTGATTAAAARTNIGALGASDTIANATTASACSGNAATATTATNVSGTVAVANGGTAGTNAGQARLNLRTMHFIGLYAAGTTYTANQVVSYTGASYSALYISATDGNVGHTPVDGGSNGYWVLMFGVAGATPAPSSPPTCYVPNTYITMFDGSLKRASMVIVGDRVLGIGGINTVTITDRVRLGTWRSLFSVGKLQISGEHNMWTQDESGDEYWAVADLQSYVFERTVLNMLDSSGNKVGLLKRQPRDALTQGLRFATSGGNWTPFDVQDLSAPEDTELIEIATDGSHSVIADGIVVGAIVSDDFDYASARWK